MARGILHGRHSCCRSNSRGGRADCQWVHSTAEKRQIRIKSSITPRETLEGLGFTLDKGRISVPVRRLDQRFKETKATPSPNARAASLGLPRFECHRSTLNDVIGKIPEAQCHELILVFRKESDGFFDIIDTFRFRRFRASPMETDANMVIWELENNCVLLFGIDAKMTVGGLAEYLDRSLRL